MSQHVDDDHYLATYHGGPLDGTTERRALVDGGPEETVSQVALVEGTEGIYWYTAGDRSVLGGTLSVAYHFDPRDSDPLEGQADEDDETLQA